MSSWPWGYRSYVFRRSWSPDGGQIASCGYDSVLRIWDRRSGRQLDQIEVGGVLIDVARHFIDLSVLKRVVDGMARLKMNVLHLHLSDDQGFSQWSATARICRGWALALLGEVDEGIVALRDGLEALFLRQF